jgi:hypothetical protein
MQVELGRIDKATTAARRVQTMVQRIVLMADGRIEDMARAADETITQVLRELGSMGASELQPVHDEHTEIPFHALTPPELYELEELLVRARGLADRIDQKRGQANAETGEGFVWGDRIRELEARAGLELHGPDTAGRE